MSIVDYIFRWMATKFLSTEAQFRAGVNLREEPGGAGEAGGAGRASASSAGSGSISPVASGSASPVASGSAFPVASGFSRKEGKDQTKPAPFAAMQNQEDAPPCSTCGSIMIRSGSCYKCANCGTTSGCA